MPKIGEIYWLATVKGTETAKQEANAVEESFEGVAGTAQMTAERQNELASKTGTATEETEKANRWSRRLQGAQGLLASALFFTTDMLGVTSAAMWGYTAATGAASGATATLYGLLAGPAGLAAGLGGFVAAVGLLSSELLGLTDVSPVAQAEADTMAGAFADMAYLIGGPLVGYLSAGFSLLTGDFEGAKNKFVNTSVEWTKAAARFAARVQLGFETAGIAVRTGVQSTVEAADWAWRRGLNSLITATNGATEGIHDSLVGGLTAAVNQAIGVINGFITAYNQYASQIPHLNATAGKLGQVSAGTGGRNVGRVGAIQNEALQSRLGRAGAAGRGGIAAARGRTGGQLARFAPDTIGGGRRTATGTGGGPQIGEQTINVEIGDQTLDIRNLSRSDRRELAEFIAEELGTNTTGFAGVK